MYPRGGGGLRYRTVPLNTCILEKVLLCFRESLRRYRRREPLVPPKCMDRYLLPPRATSLLHDTTPSTRSNQTHQPTASINSHVPSIPPAHPLAMARSTAISPLLLAKSAAPGTAATSAIPSPRPNASTPHHREAQPSSRGI